MRRKYVSGIPAEESCFSVVPTVVSQEPQNVPIEKTDRPILGPAFYPGIDRDDDNQDWFQRGNK